MYRATTPTHVFVLQIDTADIKELKVTYSQNDKIILEKGLNDVITEGDEIRVTLTQEETNMFEAHMKADVQLRIMTTGDKVLASKIFKLTINEVLNDEVIK